MAVSNEAIAALFKYLGGQGYRRPDSWKPGTPGNPSKSEIFASWRHTFRNASDGDLLVAGTVYVSNGGKWWPNAGQLIALIPPSGPPLLGWARIWDRVCTNLSSKGRNRPPGEAWRLAERDDEHEAALVALTAAGGWWDLCNSNAKDRCFAATKFERAFSVTLKTTTAARRWIAAGGSPQLQLADSETTS